MSHPSATEQRIINQRVPAEGTLWRKKKDHSEQVIILKATRWDSVNFRRQPLSSNSDFNRARIKKEHYFASEYEPAPLPLLLEQPPT
jgi:hypothetical protein